MRDDERLGVVPIMLQMNQRTEKKRLVVIFDNVDIGHLLAYGEVHLETTETVTGTDEVLFMIANDKVECMRRVGTTEDEIERIMHIKPN